MGKISYIDILRPFAQISEKRRISHKLGFEIKQKTLSHTAKVRLESEVVSFIFVYMRMRKRMRETKTKNEEDAAGIGGGGI